MTKSILRVTTLLALSFVCLFGIFSDADGNLAFALSKGIGAAAGYAAFRLYSAWRASDPLVAAYDRWATKGTEGL